MVKGGTKRKPEMKKISNKASRATTFTKRRDGLYSKAAQLCVISDAQIAILATPSSSNSNASFFSFGHSSVESVVSAYLSGQRLAPVSTCDTKARREDLGICMARKDLGLGFWWDDDKLVNSKNLEEVMEAMESMKVLMSRLKGLEDQTLTTTRVDEEDMVETTPESDEWSEMELNQLLQDCDDVPPPPHVHVVTNTDKVEEDQNVSEKMESIKVLMSHLKGLEDQTLTTTVDPSPESDEWSEMELNQLLQDCDDLPPLHVVTDKEEEDQNVSEKTYNNYSLPGAVAGSLEEEALNIDWDAIFSFNEELSDEYKMYV